MASTMRLAGALACLWAADGIRTVEPEQAAMMLNSDAGHLGAALMQAAEGQESPSYFFDMPRLKQGYQNMFCGLSKDKCRTLKNFPGSPTMNYLGWEEAVEHLLPIPKLQGEGKIWRGNELGYFIMNEGLWDRDYKTIGLGVTVEQHKFFRPVVDGFLGSAGEGRIWSEAIIDAHLADYLRGKSTLNAKAGIFRWTTHLMHKLHLNIDLSPENVTRFMAFQGDAIMKSVLPVCVMCDGIRNERDVFLKELYIPAIQSDTRGVFPKDLSASQLHFMASSLMDSMLFAGGMSVGNLIRSGLGVLYADPKGVWNVTNKQITDDNVDQFVFEMVRLFPAVLGFPWYPLPNKEMRYIVNVATALRDDTIWADSGPVLEFHLRPLELYKQHARIAWAEPANGPAAWAVQNPGRTGNLLPMSRGCPGQALSFTIMRTFFKRWAQSQMSWHVIEAPKGGVTFEDHRPYVGEVTLAKVVKVGSIKVVDWGVFDYKSHVRWVVVTAGDASHPATLIVYELDTRRDDPANAVHKILLEVKDTTVEVRDNYIKKVSPGAQCFKIHGKEELRFCSDSDADRQAWMTAIKEAMYAQPPPPTQP